METLEHRSQCNRSSGRPTARLRGCVGYAPFMARVSVIIPAVDEEAAIAAAVLSVKDHAEVIVVDGGSRDGTRDVAAASGARVLACGRGRGRQLHAGALAAAGDWLTFLHADTRLEPGWSETLRGLDADVAGGAFTFALDSSRPAYRLLETAVAWRAKHLRLPYGDQAIFARRAAYEAAGGFAPLPILEDVDFVRRLDRIGRLVILPQKALTSPRRWERHGLVATTLRNVSLLTLYAAGLPPSRLATLYR
jgi:rSAM/selenodomain-associated transferase 2